ncbi:MAG: hypothetical protein QGH82_02875, partial [Candidatus Woesearchaeota archaeon]|nr:hypothetical protein [Candidatus Woesearchaeota archaeon]
MVNRVYSAALLCIVNRTPFAIENPEQSMMWDLTKFKHLEGRPGVVKTTYHYCMFGEKYHKTTKVMSYGFSTIATRSTPCNRKNNICSRTGQKHEVLSGTVECPEGMEHLLEHGKREPVVRSAKPVSKPDKKRMIWKTKLAEPYPIQLCESWAEMILERIEVVPSDASGDHQGAFLVASAGTTKMKDITIAPAATKAKSKPPKDHYILHFPKHEACETCNKAKCQKKQNRRKLNQQNANKDTVRPTFFGEQITADHVIFNERDQSHDLKRFLVTVKDRFTNWLEVFPCVSKDANHTEMSLRDFYGAPDNDPRHWGHKPLLYTDNSGEFIAAAKALGWLHDCATDNRPATNGVIERANRIILAGLRCALHESGLEHKLWSQAVACFCQFYNICHLHEDGRTSYQRRHNLKPKDRFVGEIVPYGAKAFYLPTAEREVLARQKAAPRMVPGIFAGYKFNHRGLWTGDYLVYDYEAYQNWTGSYNLPLHTTKEIYLPGQAPDSKEDDAFVFPAAIG